MTRSKYPPPSTVAGTAVKVTGQPLILLNEKWVTLVPVNDDDHRVWEFNVTTGRGPLQTL